MRDAFGGLMNMVIIVVFLVLVSGYLAFNVNYTKAFRAKNKIITLIEQYEGHCDNDSYECNTKISTYLNELGYKNFRISLSSSNPKTYCNSSYGYCIEEVEVSNINGKQKVYYKVTTAIVIDIPIINNIMPNLKLFQVSGSTKTFIKSKLESS